MGTSLFQWTKLLLANNLFSNSAAVLGLTSEGTHNFFKDYAEVAAAKAVMESNIRYTAIELAKFGIRANLVNAGFTDSKALKVFPDYTKFLDKAKSRNPMGRLTSADDVAKVISFLASEDAAWINGTILTVDGGEQLLSIF
jgi:enoyl-[acyl-carrier-protein] reductase (NADH)